MLVVKIFINERQIDEIWVHNIGFAPYKRNKYRIEKPEGYENEEIEHLRQAGYRGLLIKALEVLDLKAPDGE